MRIRKAVITAAGHGTRLFPATKAVKKELFPLVDRDGRIKPIIQMVVEEAVESGIEEVCIVVAPGGDEPLRDYFSKPMAEDLDRRIAKSPELYEQYRHVRGLNDRLHYAFQHTQEGYGHAVYYHIYVSATEKRCTRQVLDAFDLKGSTVAALARTPESMLKYFGTMGGTPDPSMPGLYKATEIVEKPSVEYAREHFRIEGLPAGEYMTWFGMHAMMPEIFDCLEYHIKNDIRERGEIQFTSAQELLRERHDDYYGLEVNGSRHDIGIPSGYASTMALLAGVEHL
jgi:UTP--glucose-1-phosphate uridylyltransferase